MYGFNYLPLIILVGIGIYIAYLFGNNPVFWYGVGSVASILIGAIVFLISETRA